MSIIDITGANFKYAQVEHLRNQNGYFVAWIEWYAPDLPAASPSLVGRATALSFAYRVDLIIMVFQIGFSAR